MKQNRITHSFTFSTLTESLDADSTCLILRTKIGCRESPSSLVLKAPEKKRFKVWECLRHHVKQRSFIMSTWGWLFGVATAKTLGKKLQP